MIGVGEEAEVESAVLERTHHLRELGHRVHTLYGKIIQATQRSPQKGSRPGDLVQLTRWPVVVRMGMLGGIGCIPAFEQIRGEQIELKAGEVRKYRIARGDNGLYLIKVPSTQ